MSNTHRSSSSPVDHRVDHTPDHQEVDIAGTPGADTNNIPPAYRSNSRRKWLLLALGGVVLVGGVSVCERAWRATQLREAYLPDLRARVSQHALNGPLLVVLAGREAQARRYAAAAEAYRQAVAEGENTPPIWLAWSATEAAAGDRDSSGSILLLGMRQQALASEMRAALDRCRKLPPAAAPPALAQAICPQGPQAVIDPYVRGSFLNGIVAWMGRRHPDSSGYATRVEWAKAAPNSVQAQQLWADALLRNERYAEAEAAARSALNLSPDALSAHLTLADALYHEGDIGKAGIEYAKSARAHPDSLRALLGLGQVTLDKKMIPISLDVYGKAVKLAPKSADAWIGLGHAQYNAALDLGSSLSAFQTAAQLAPTRTDFYPTYANALRAQSRYPEAEALLRKRIAIAPNEAQSLYYLALVLLAYDVTPAREAEAEQCLRHSLDIEPQGISVRERLGRLLVEERRAAEAIPLLEAVLSQDPHDAAAAMALARGYRIAGRVQESRTLGARIDAIARYSTAVKGLEDDIKLQPQNPILYLKLAKLYASGGENERAARYREAADMILRDPQHSAAALRVLAHGSDAAMPLAERPGIQH
jgi:tetratricopeptide (TPR) repeat protein